MGCSASGGVVEGAESPSDGVATSGTALARTLELVVAATASGGTDSAVQPASKPAAIDTTSSASRRGSGDGDINALWPKCARCGT